MRSNEFKRFSSQSQAMYALLDTRFKDKYFFHSLFSLHTHDLLSFCVFHTQTHTQARITGFTLKLCAHFHTRLHCRYIDPLIASLTLARYLDNAK